MVFEHLSKLSVFIVIPIILSVVLYIINKAYEDKIPYMVRQVFVGIVFGLLAVLNTERGVSIAGYVMNVRDAGPVCAGLIFGAPAGFIAGLIGGLERWFSVYWGVGAYTRISCSVSTFLAGVFAAVLKKYVFDNHICKPVYAAACGLVTEVFHMLMVFVTHMNDVIEAFDVVRTCAIPMITANIIAVGISVFIIYLIRHRRNEKDLNRKISVSQVFQRRILIVVVISFLITNFFNFILQESLARTSIKELLSLNIEDVKGDILSAIDNSMLNNSITISEKLNKIKEIKLEDLELMKETYGVDEINIVNPEGIITLSTYQRYVGFDMRSGEQSSEFMKILTEGEHYFVQDIEKITYDNETYMKYIGVRLKQEGFVQVGYSYSKFHEVLTQQLEPLALNRHIGEAGHVIIANSSTGQIVSDYENSTKETLEDYGFDHSKLFKEDTMYLNKINDVDSFYEVAYTEGYTILAYQPYDEACFSEIISIYITTFLQIIVYAAIFVIVFFVINGTIVRNVVIVNNKLEAITNGDLNTVVDVRNNEEFDLLSTGINSTVNKLKELIKDAEERMKAELEYAAEIQRSALPSNFPAFPDRNDIDIYATMTPAKEVGGDFYDFYFIDSNKLAILIADVSGKGIPASLFMMRAKTIINSYAEFGIAVNDVFTNVNYNLCEGNEAGLFVTAWMGIVDLETGHMQFANAGHNPPLIRKPNGEFEYLRTKPGFVLGGMEGISYKMNEIDIEPGSEIFIYTDGLTEAQNVSKELYGEDRLLKSINSYMFTTSEDMCRYIKKGVDDFVGEADQFDDLTMLHLKYIKKTFD